MKDSPSRDELRELAEKVGGILDSTAGLMGIYQNRFYFFKVISVLRNLASEQKDEEPKVESLRKAAQRIYDPPDMTTPDAIADVSAIVLGQVDRLAELVRAHLMDAPMCEGSKAVRELREKMEKMREGAEE